MISGGDFRTLVMLRAKQGELDALHTRDSDDQVQPMLSLDHDPDVSVANLLTRVEATVRETGERGRIMMIDTTNMASAPGLDGPAGVLELLADRLAEPADLFQQDSVPIIPVTHSQAAPDVLARVGHLGHDLGHGCAIRARVGSATQASVDSAVNLMDIDPSELDLVVDLAYLTSVDEQLVDQVHRLIDALDQCGDFRSTSVLSGSIPKTLDQTSQWERPRFEEILWRSLVRNGAGHVRFGDYGVVHPIWAPGGFPSKHINLKYTCTEHWLYLRQRVLESDGQVKTGRTVALVSQNLLASGSYAGPEFSWGDAQFAAAAATTSGQGFGSTTKVVAFATSHHLAYLGGLEAA